MVAQTPELLTAAEFAHVDIPGRWVELVRGRLVVREPPGIWHGVVAARLTYRLGAYVYERGLGELCAQDTGFRIFENPDTVRAADIAFVSAERAGSLPRSGYGTVIPDLVAEIVSPNDRPGELLNKVGDWLEAGVRVVWVIDPPRGMALVHDAGGSTILVPMDGRLEGGDVLPGFSVPLSDILR